MRADPSEVLARGEPEFGTPRIIPFPTRARCEPRFVPHAPPAPRSLKDEQMSDASNTQLELLPIPPKGTRLRGFGHTWFRERIAAGDITARKIGRALRFEVASLDAYLARAPKATLRPTRRQRIAARTST